MILHPGAPVTITNGPSKFDLMVAFADRFGSANGVRRTSDQRTVTFTTGVVTAPGDRGAALAAEVYIQVLGHEAGTGHSWSFEGTLVPTSPFAVEYGSVRRVKGHYDTKTHKGSFSCI